MRRGHGGSCWIPRSAVAGVLVAVLLGAAPSAGASAPSGWVTRSVLPAQGRRAVGPHLVVAPDGVGFVAAESRVVSMRRPFGAAVGALISPDGTVSPPEVIAPADEGPYRLGIGVDASGTVTAGYTSGNGSHARVFVRTRTPAGRFGARVLISPPGVPSTLLRLLERPDGLTVALLSLGTGSSRRYAVVARAGARAFRRVLSLPPAAATPDIAVAPDDRAIIAWSQPGDRGMRRIEARDWDPGHRPTNSYELGSGRGFVSPLVAILSGGGALVAWPKPLAGGREAVVVAERTAAGRRFSKAITVTPERNLHDAGDIRLDGGAGRVLLSTVEADARGPYRATLRTWTPSGGLSAPDTVSPGGGDAFSPVSGARGSRTVVVWQHTQNGQGLIEAASSDGGDPFTAPALLSNPELTVQSLSGPYVAVDQRGVALVAWIDYTERGQVELARLAP